MPPAPHEGVATAASWEEVRTMLEASEKETRGR
jgi:hypothetical protein